MFIFRINLQVIYANQRRGLSPWATCKFARDLLTALNTLHKVLLLQPAYSFLFPGSFWLLFLVIALVRRAWCTQT